MGDRAPQHLPQRLDSAPFQLAGQLGQLPGDRDGFGARDCQRLICLVDVEVVGVPVKGQPVSAVLRVLERLREQGVVVPTAHPCGQFLVAGDSSAVLWRTGHSPGGASHGGERFIEDRLDDELVVPSVAEVALVPEFVALLGEDLVEAYVGLGYAFVALIEVELGREARRTVVVAHAEPMQMRVVPPHRGLDRDVHPWEGQVAGKLEAAPEGRLGAVQVESDPEPAAPLRDWEELGPLIASVSRRCW